MNKSDDELKDHQRIVKIQRDLLLKLTRADTLQDTLSICLDAAMEISGMDCGGIYLLDEDRGLKLVQSKCLSNTFLNAVDYYSPQATHTKLIISGTPLYLPYSNRNLPFPKVEVEYDEGLKALAVIPMRYNGEIIGCLDVSSRNIEEIPEFIRKSLETLVATAGILISKAKTEELLRKNEQRFIQAEKMAKLGHWERSFADNTSSWSKGTYDIFGVDPDGFKPTLRDFFKAIHPSDLKSVEKALNYSRANGTPLDIEFRIGRPDGEIINVQSHAEIVLRVDKEQDLFIGTIQDITMRKQAEEDLRIKSLRLQEMNTALKVLIEHREKEINEIEDKIMENVKKLIIPYLDKLDNALNKKENRVYVEMI